MSGMEMENKIVDAQSPELRGRIPYKVSVANDGKLLFKWIYIGNKIFSEPFFSESTSSCLSLPENSDMPFTTGETLLQIADSIETVELSAFIFHVSRCGSTLLAQMLSIDERFIVLSEVPLLDDLLRISFSHKEKNISDVDQLFFAVLHILGKKRNGKEKHLFVKTDSWHLLFFERIRKMYPTIPALLLYRSPKEVIRSQQKLSGMHAVKNVIQPEIFGFTNEQITRLLPEKYLEMVMECYFEKCLEILKVDSHAQVISYHDGMMEMIQRTIGFCGVSIQPQVFEAMKNRTANHSKNPGNKFKTEIAIAETVDKTELEKLFDKLNEEKNRKQVKSMLNQ
jgi:hypothetical protein